MRLEKSCFEDPAQLKKLAKIAGLTRAKFRTRLGYLMGLK
jgi:hypothetical protein